MEHFPDEPCFNTDLEKVIMDETLIYVPRILVDCIDILEKNQKFMETSGLYRVSGNHTQIQTLRFQVG